MLSLQRSNPRRRAVAAVLIAVVVPVLIGFAALTIDVGYMFDVRAQLQDTADASALAAAALMQDEAQSRAAAIQFASANYADGGTTVAAGDVQYGNWDMDLQLFTPNVGPFNAVEVIASRSDQHGNPIAFFFASIFGVHSTDVSARSVAMVEFPNNPDCFNRGIMAAGTIWLGQDTTLDNYCAYGRQGGNLVQGTQVINGSLVGALDISTVTYGQQTVGMPDNLIAMDREIPLAGNLVNIIDDMEAGVGLPPQINNVIVANSLPAVLAPNTAYIINGNIKIDQDYTSQDIIIAARGDIMWGQDGAIRNSGTPGNNVAIGLLATGKITLKQDYTAEGVNLVATGPIWLGQDMISLDATVHSASNVSVMQDASFVSDYEHSFSGTSALSSSYGANASTPQIVQ